MITNGRQTMNLKVVITKGEDGWYVVTVPSLPGCITQGRTIKEAKANIKEAISLYLESDEEIIPGKGARIIEVAV
jgi:predicted RNase H-like HicB family nuclease